MLRWLQLFPPSASTMASRVDALFFFLTAFSCLMSLLIVVLIVGFSIRYRRRSPNEIGAPLEGSVALEMFWITIPLFIALGMFIWGAILFVSMRRAPPDSMEVFVVAKQWMWKLQHPEGTTEINELHIPLGRDVKLTMTSQDVIHSFFVPAFRVKTDVLPGRYTTIWFHPTALGSYHLFCAEYCGTNHAAMGGSVVVMTPTDFQNWLAERSGGAAAMESSGRTLFEQSECSTCHLPSGTGKGPSLLGVYGSGVRLQDGRTVLADDDYVRESILSPQAKLVAGYPPDMPSFQGRFTEEQVTQLIAYVRSLSSPAKDATELR